MSSQPLHQTLPWAVFDQVASALQQTASGAFCCNESDLSQRNGRSRFGRFVLVVSSDFSALLQGIPIDSNQCDLTLTFLPEEITAFARSLQAYAAIPTLEIEPNQSDRQTQFTAKLIEILTTSASTQALHQQIGQERLLNQLMTLIRHSLDLSVILETAVHQVRDFLQADRLIIYQFNFPAPSCELASEASLIAQAATPNLDGITYESRSSEAIPAAPDGGALTWTTIEHDPNSTVATLLNRPQTAMRSEVVTPIVVQNELWGLLVVHQCLSSRQWQDRERQLLQRIAEHLAIAIYQAKLYAQLQQQKNTLEQQIIDRTQALRDTLIASQAASRAKSEFLATMSHELRSPLTTIIGMASTLLRYHTNLREVGATLTLQKQNEYLQTIHDRGEHLLALINDILDLSEVEAGRTILQIEAFSLAAVAEQLIQALQEKATAKQVELCLALMPDSNHSFQFQADSQRVQQILLNLLSNAIKFTPAAGRVTLRIRINGDTAILQVEDTGIGIPEDQRSLLFQKFQQLDASYHRKYEGTGLGLALTKQLVELHSGTIEVESEVGVGSKFTVFLPMQPLSVIQA